MIKYVCTYVISDNHQIRLPNQNDSGRRQCRVSSESKNLAKLLYKLFIQIATDNIWTGIDWKTFEKEHKWQYTGTESKIGSEDNQSSSLVAVTSTALFIGLGFELSQSFLSLMEHALAEQHLEDIENWVSSQD